MSNNEQKQPVEAWKPFQAGSLPKVGFWIELQHTNAFASGPCLICPTIVAATGEGDQGAVGSLIMRAADEDRARRLMRAAVLRFWRYASREVVAGLPAEFVEKVKRGQEQRVNLQKVESTYGYEKGDVVIDDTAQPVSLIEWQSSPRVSLELKLDPSWVGSLKPLFESRGNANFIAAMIPPKAQPEPKPAAQPANTKPSVEQLDAGVDVGAALRRERDALRLAHGYRQRATQAEQRLREAERASEAALAKNAELQRSVETLARERDEAIANAVAAASNEFSKVLVMMLAKNGGGAAFTRSEVAAADLRDFTIIRHETRDGGFALSVAKNAPKR